MVDRIRAILFESGLKAVAQRYSVKMVFLEISQKSGLRYATLLKKRPWNKCFPVDFAEFLRTHFSYRTPPVAAFVALNDDL